jgi:hypothetical protein
MRSTAAAGAYQKLASEKGITIDLSKPNADLILEATKLMRNSQGSSFFKDQPLAITAGYGLTDNKSVNKLLLTFQSFMLNRWDNINRQIYRLGIKEKNYSKAISSAFWLLIFAGAVEEGIRRGTRKITGVLSKNKAEEKDFSQNVLLNILQSVPLLGQLTSAITYSSNPVPVINTLDDLLEQWINQNNICPYTGVTLIHPIRVKDEGLIYMASLDRIDSSIGYLKGNIQFISVAANLAKNNMSHEQMIVFCKLITENWK